MSKVTGEPLYINGARVPFTFWPENHLRYGPIHAANPWQCLLGFLGDDACSRRCRAYIEQARDFFVAARDASVTTMPLMLYYSYMNLVKAFLLNRNAIADDGKGDHHGLIRDEPPARYGSLSDLTFRVPSDDGKYNYLFGLLVRACGFPMMGGSGSITLSDMLGQLPGIHDGYVAVTGKPRCIYPVILEFRHEPGKRQVWVAGRLDDHGRWSDAERERVRRLLGCALEWSMDDVSGKQIAFRSSKLATYREDPSEVLRSELVDPLRPYLSSEQTPNGFRYHLICGHGFTAQVAANHAAMFVLGMIVRYSPEVIEDLRGEWLIHEYLATQPTQFAYLLGSGFIRNEILPTPLMA